MGRYLTPLCGATQAPTFPGGTPSARIHGCGASDLGCCPHFLMSVVRASMLLFRYSVPTRPLALALAFHL